MSEHVHLHWGVSRVHAATLDLLEDEERRCLDLSVLQCSVLRQMAFPWAYRPDRLVEEHVGYEIPVEMPVAYVEALEELDQLLSGAYDGPKEGCPVGEVYVDRGDPSAWDFQIGNLAVDGAWHSLELGGIITDEDATDVEILVQFRGGAAQASVQMRETNNVNVYNRLLGSTQGDNLFTTLPGRVTLGPDRSMDYFVSATMVICNIVVRGWWKPA